MGDRHGWLKVEAERKPRADARAEPAAAARKPAAREPLPQWRVPWRAWGTPAASSGPLDPAPLRGGVPLPHGLQAKMERHVGANLGRVRVHTDARAQWDAAALSARAFTFADDVFLGAGERMSDEALMAHELAHVAQQRGGTPTVQRQTASAVPDSPAEAQAAAAAAKVADPQVAGLIVDDGQALGPGQMARGAFLAQLRAATTATAAEILGPVWARGGCPYLEAWFAQHNGDDATTLERLVQRYAGKASTAAAYIPAVCARLHDGIARWSAGVALGDHLGAAGLGAEAAAAGTGAVMAKEAPGARFAAPGSPARVAGQLGPGAPLDGGAAARLGGTLGEDFGDVRIHADVQAARLAGELGATAFTVGSHIAFAAGEYQPGTITGKALLAHELAHVVQQRSASADGRGLERASLDNTAHEDDADETAVGAMARLYGAGSAAAEKLNARPRLRAGLGLQRCKAKERKPEPPPNRPAPKVDSKELTKGTMTWKLEPSGNNSAQIQISFKPKPIVAGKTITFLQTVLYTTTSGGEAVGETLPSPKFAAGKRRIDILGSDYDPFYGAKWDGTKWVEEGLDPEDTQKGYKNAPSSANDSSGYMFDRPSVNVGERQLLEAVAVVPETGETLGALKWGLEYGESGADRWKLLGAEKNDCNDTPSPDFAPTLEKFYTQRYDAILDGFPANDATLTAPHKAQLDPIAAQLKGNPALVVIVGGFADATETDPSGISTKRTQVVKDYLAQKGAPEAQIKARSYGASWARYPPSATEARNRRVQLLVREAEPSELPPPPSGSGSSGPTSAPDAGR